MRKIAIVPGEYYHVFNRGNNKQDIFYDQKDWARLLFLILYFQSPLNFYNLDLNSQQHLANLDDIIAGNGRGQMQPTNAVTLEGVTVYFFGKPISPIQRVPGRDAYRISPARSTTSSART